ncbi:MAG: hypothetical protein AAF429_12815 [Pseudomonadota bacterium]
MEIVSVEDIDRESLATKTFDLGIFFCGFEDRASYLIRQKKTNLQISDHLVLDYENDPEILSKAANKQRFKKLATSSKIDVSSKHQFESVAELLSRKIEKIGKERVKILIDYSSMRRTLYSDILCFFHFGLPDIVSANLYFSYSMGNYVGKFAPKYVFDHETLTGLEGITSQSKEKLAVFNLGFEPISTLTMLEIIEADEVHGILASPGVTSRSAQRTRKANSEFIEQNLTEELNYIPLRSVERYVRFCLEQYGRKIDSHDVVFVPYGPKPHVLGSVVCCFIEQTWSNIYIRGTESRRVNVTATGEVVVSKISFR